MDIFRRDIILLIRAPQQLDPNSSFSNNNRSIWKEAVASKQIDFKALS